MWVFPWSYSLKILNFLVFKLHSNCFLNSPLGLTCNELSGQCLHGRETNSTPHDWYAYFLPLYTNHREKGAAWMCSALSAFGKWFQSLSSEIDFIHQWLLIDCSGESSPHLSETACRRTGGEKGRQGWETARAKSLPARLLATVWCVRVPSSLSLETWWPVQQCGEEEPNEGRMSGLMPQLQECVP